MKYFLRAVKYYIFLIVLMSAILAALVLTGLAEANIETMFRGGYDSLWQIALLFAVIAAAYPRFGFVRKEFPADGSDQVCRDMIKDFMESRGYAAESENGDEMTFRRRSFFSRIPRFFEDRIAITAGAETVSVEGLRKDVFRIAAGLQYALSEEKD